MNPLFDPDVNPIIRRLQDSFEPPLTVSDLEQVAGELGIEWPVDFAEFLLQYNGGYFKHPVWFDVLVPGEWVKGGTVQDMSGLFPRNPKNEDDMRMSAYRLEYLPDTTLPIAGCWGDYLLLCVRGDHYGKIYFWDRAEGGPEDIHLVADSFTQFIKCLRPEEDDERPRERLPAFQAVEAGDEVAVEAYLADGGSADLRNAKGETLLMCAARRSWPRVVKRLLAAGAAVDARDAYNQTPLYFAMRGQSIDSIKLLAAAGANLACRDPKGRGLVERARGLNFWPEAKKLLQLGAPER